MSDDTQDTQDKQDRIDPDAVPDEGSTPDAADTSDLTDGTSEPESTAPGEDATTKDGTDAGVPMLPGSPGEPQGPEDAFGEGDKRGDYAERVGGPHAESVALEGGGDPIRDGDGNVVDVKPKSKLVRQDTRVSEVGDAEGLKGGVETAPTA